jgi:hypothetical protein
MDERANRVDAARAAIWDERVTDREDSCGLVAIRRSAARYSASSQTARARRPPGTRASSSSRDLRPSEQTAAQLTSPLQRGV